eukprot:NODE_24325_length_629_cov_5.189243.p8 GENE.NODE_24325_length_629_cov_5.189243~~NODE_24325_length_629_cov_5.189243.p8  ORF type:complete len:57 (+),score=13.38 NODE_24325_length_629_cov_5.189243:244-414(+)
MRIFPTPASRERELQMEQEIPAERRLQDVQEVAHDTTNKCVRLHHQLERRRGAATR